MPNPSINVNHSASTLIQCSFVFFFFFLFIWLSVYAFYSILFPVSCISKPFTKRGFSERKLCKMGGGGYKISSTRLTPLHSYWLSLRRPSKTVSILITGKTFLLTSDFGFESINFLYLFFVNHIFFHFLRPRHFSIVQNWSFDSPKSGFSVDLFFDTLKSWILLIFLLVNVLFQQSCKPHDSLIRVNQRLYWSKK